MKNLITVIAVMSVIAACGSRPTQQSKNITTVDAVNGTITMQSLGDKRIEFVFSADDGSVIAMDVDLAMEVPEDDIESNGILTFLRCMKRAAAHCDSAHPCPPDCDEWIQCMEAAALGCSVGTIICWPFGDQ